METAGDGLRRTRVFYCDPMQSGQKGTLENNHIELRYILPKETDLRALGLVGQVSLNLVLSHVNSVPVEKFGGKSPLEVTEFMFPDLYESLVSFGIRKVPKDSIILRPYLLKSYKPNSREPENMPACQLPAGKGTPGEELCRNTCTSEPLVADTAPNASADTGRKKGRRPKESAIPMERIRQLAAEGKTPKEISSLMGVSVATYYRRMAVLK